jgi:SAM-dependent methyltransferase
MRITNLIPVRILSHQARKPSGLLGRYVMTRLFNSGNADLNAFVKYCLELKPEDNVLEIGFGPGKLINDIASIVTNGTVQGVDYSEVMVQQAEKTNASHISSGRVLLHEGECGSLPFEDNMFDKLCSANTVYFWKNPEDYFAEMFRVIRPGGKIVIGFRDDRQMNNLNLRDDVFSLVSKSDVLNLLSGAGFTGVQIKEKRGFPFASYCGVATKI